MKKKNMITLIGALCLSVGLLSGCTRNQTLEELAMSNAEVNASTAESSVEAITSNAESSVEEVSTATQEPTETPVNDGIAEAIRQETADVDSTPAPAMEDDTREATAEIGESIPNKYISLQLKEMGTLEHITYTTYDYFGDGSEITKEANVYLPYGYDESNQYNVLYLMHGIGGDETEWGMTNINSRIKIIMDNLIYNGDIEPFIIVTPNGRSAANHDKTTGDFNSFYCFGQELRNDLIPYMESHYSTYADYDANGYDMSLTRDHRAMAGLSMGGMQTINIGIGECVDLFSYFGAFSAAPTSNPAEKTAEILTENTLPIHYFYNICGTNDDIAYASASLASKELPKYCDQFVDGENFTWQELPGGHDFNIWYLGFYNFAQIVFQ